MIIFIETRLQNTIAKIIIFIETRLQNTIAKIIKSRWLSLTDWLVIW